MDFCPINQTYQGFFWSRWFDRAKEVMTYDQVDGL